MHSPHGHTSNVYPTVKDTEELRNTEAAFIKAFFSHTARTLLVIATLQAPMGFTKHAVMAANHYFARGCARSVRCLKASQATW